MNNSVCVYVFGGWGENRYKLSKKACLTFKKNFSTRPVLAFGERS